VRQFPDGRRTITWKSSPAVHGRADGRADVVADLVCVSYPRIRGYREVCSEVYWLGGRRYELWRGGRLAGW
jgi:hypothetical protein